jgi:ATP-binding cassette, subfamily C (CFTR/MRP), member 1
LLHLLLAALAFRDSNPTSLLMAAPRPDPEKDELPTGLLAGTRDADREEKASVDLAGSKDDSGSVLRKAESGQEEDEAKRTGLVPAQTTATTASGLTGIESNAAPKRKPWYKTPNPFRWGKIPPVPEKRTVSREYTASFLSKVYFQWMSPLMSVSTRFRHALGIVD